MARHRLRFAAPAFAVALALTACGGDDEADGDATTTTEAPATDDGNDATPDGDEDAALPALGDPTEAPELDDDGLAPLAEGCFDGSMPDCDELYFTSNDEAVQTWAGECGGRLAEGIFGQCDVYYGEG